MAPARLGRSLHLVIPPRAARPMAVRGCPTPRGDAICPISPSFAALICRSRRLFYLRAHPRASYDAALTEIEAARQDQQPHWAPG